MINVENLKPFPKFCYTIGMIPSSYKESLTYEEQLMWFCNYLENTVIPTVNNNGMAVEELQNLLVQLKDYVDNYFDNLDIQTEIDNKLDDMAESGQLAEIIAIYIRSNAVLGFQTKQDMIEAENIVNGSICRTISDEEIGDNGGRLYFVREVTNDDTIDGINIIALDVSNTLVAVLINDDRFTHITDDIIGDLAELTTSSKTSVVNSINSLKSATDNSVNSLNTALGRKVDKLTELVVFGDSWSDPTSLDAIWANIAGAELNLNVDNYALSGGYISGTASNSLTSQVNTFYNDTLVDKTKVKYIVILGGVNDYRNSVTWTDLYTKLEEQIELLKTYCPQAKIIYVSNCRWYYDKDQGDYWCGVHQEVRTTCKIVTYNIFGTFGKEMYNSTNYFHLTQTGQKLMCSNIIATLTGGELQYFEDEIILDNSDATVKITSQRIQNMVYINFDIYAKTNFSSLTFANPTGYYFPYYPLIRRLVR